MKRLNKLFSTLRQDESGASFLEYTVLLGILLAGAIGFITTVGGWTTGQWSTLATAL